MINKSIPNFRKLVLIFGGPMSQTRRRRCRRSSGNTTLRPHEQRSGSSLSHTALPASRTSVNLDDDQDDFMPPKPWPPRPDQRTGGSSSRTRPPAAPSCVTWDDDDDFMPPKPWPPRLDQGTRGLSSRNAPPSAPSCVNWDDDDDDFMPPKPWPPR